MVIKICKVCGKEFDARGRAKCCSSECSKINKREYDKQYYDDNREHKLEYQKQYNEDNREHRLEYMKQYYDDNREHILEYMKQWRDDNREHILEYMKQWRDDNPEYMKQWREDNREYRREYEKQYYYDNREHRLEYMKQWRDDNREHIREYKKQYYDDNRDEILEKDMLRRQNIISELCEQYDGDLEQILENIPSRWHVREAKMRVWFNESYYDGIIAKIKSTPVCEVTGEKTNDLVIHHLYSFNTHPELGNDPENMVRITTDIHKKFHSIYGYGNNTPEQWFEFIENL